MVVLCRSNKTFDANVMCRWEYFAILDSIVNGITGLNFFGVIPFSIFSGLAKSAFAFFALRISFIARLTIWCMPINYMPRYLTRFTYGLKAIFGIFMMVKLRQRLIFFASAAFFCHNIHYNTTP